MTVYVKSGGAWRAATNGRLWIKNGGTWRLANYCYIKSGGAWRDSGYRGYPNPPTPPYVQSWPEFYNVTVTFSGPAAGGAPVDHYEVVMTNSALNPDVNWPNTNAGGNIIDYNNANTSGSQTFGVAADYRVGFFCRSVTAAGLKSAWVAGHRAQIGHPEQGHNVTVQNTQAWSSSLDIGYAHRGEVKYIVVPSGYYMTQWTHSYALNFAGAYLSKPTAQGNRQIQYYNTRDGSPGSVPPWDISITPWAATTWYEGISSVDGQGLGWGMYFSGIGWTLPGNDAQIMYGTMRLDGFYYYNTTQYVVDVAHVANNYW